MYDIHALPVLLKGTIYLSGYGIEERQAVTRVHDPANGIVSVVTCSTMHGEEKMPENADYCDRSRRRYNSFDYEQLMNTTFALVPGGRSPGSFRLGEVRVEEIKMKMVMIMLMGMGIRMPSGQGRTGENARDHGRS